ncbi:acyltransferase family protein [Undibacterium flavidum]|uniref:Acyltransferase n=1 Tax=Undibacterium flavidum TaxID=2762297 RepID=A0ABR6Y6G0_9BURK|nr:acyltransferase [Undibacterium flavidum]MBC3872207.1 acyltransferase [Undibacterium flavidum]
MLSLVNNSRNSSRNSSRISSRINGLDTLRACAILLVLMYHYMVFVSHEPSFGFLSEIGWVGVDLFFVLSGYLIGNQIFTGLRSTSGFSLKTFYIRRALRTLPNFYVVLAIYFLFPIEAGGKAVTPLWKFLTFTQNFDLKPGSAFSHAWSLSIEEQFYVVLPLLAIATIAFLKSVRAMWVVLLSAMAGAALMRYLMWQQVGGDGVQYYVTIYYSSWCRFDELLPGVALALWKNFHPAIWDRALKRGHVSLVGGAILSGLAMFLFTSFNYSEEQGFLWYTTTFGYTILASGFALLTLAGLSPNSALYRWRIPGAASLALWSYALYLVHKPLMNALIRPFEAWGWSVKSLAGIGAMFAVSFFAAYVLFRVVETPFMRLRDRYFPYK